MNGSSSGGACARLRQATAREHARLEAAIDMASALAGDRTRLLLAYWSFHAGAEAAMAPWLADLEDVSFIRRRRRAVLEQALADRLQDVLPQPPAVPQLRSEAAALGALYVTEGSTLGGRMILRAAVAAGTDLGGLEFLDPYGRETGAMWLALRAALDRRLAEAAAFDAAAEAADTLFAFAAARLAAVPQELAA